MAIADVSLVESENPGRCAGRWEMDMLSAGVVIDASAWSRYVVVEPSDAAVGHGRTGFG